MITPTPTPSPRLVSLDALRGFDMFWIVGADSLVRALDALSPTAPVRFLAAQLEHKDWAGFAFYDLIFPLFVFIVGVSLVFSLTGRLEREGRPAVVKKILRRAAVLFLLGIFYNGGLSQPWPEVRLVGVLQRIALAYAAAGILFCYFRPRQLVIIGAALLLGYWAALSFVPIRDIQLDNAALAARLGVEKPTLAQAHAAFDATTARVSGRFDPGLNLTNHLDFQYLPGRNYDKYYDPEGLLSTIPAVVTCLIGVFAGLLLKRVDLDARQKLLRLAIGGLLAVAAGWLWHLDFPVIKKLWTSSYVLVAGGYSLLLLGAFYYVIDVREWRRWCQPFVWIGTNPITIYLSFGIIGYDTIARRLAGGSVAAWLDVHVARGWGTVTLVALSLGAVFALARFLYRRGILLRV